jgi:urea transport system permease protein
MRSVFYACRASLLSTLILIGPLSHAQDQPAPEATAEPLVEAAQAAPHDYAGYVRALPEASYSEKQELLKQIVETRDDKAGALLQALLDGRLYTRGESTDVVIATGEGDTLALTDAVSGESAGSASSDALKKIGSNNALRKALRGLIAQLQLASEDDGVRLAAVREMMRSLDDSTVEVLRAHRAKESDAAVQEAIDVGLALADLQSSDPEVRLAAADHLDGQLASEVYNALLPLTEKNEDGSYREPDARVRSAAQAAVRSIESKRKLYGAVETLFFGLSLGSVLVLAAIGLAITFGVMGIINMAHGELIMLGAYTAYVMQQLMPQHIAAATLLSIPMAFIVSGLAGVAIERGIVRFLYGRPLETLLATFGLSLVLQQLVRSIFSPLNRSVSTPEFMSGSLVVNDALSLTYNRLYIVVFMFVVFIALQTLLKRTSLGLKVRAVSQNRGMARAMGVKSEWVDAATFGLGSGIAGVAGVALSQLTNVGPNLGQAYIIDSFMVVVFGGVGNLWGTLISGMSLGVINKLLEPYAGAVMAKILVLVFLIVFIQKRPRGLFPQKGRMAEG